MLKHQCQRWFKRRRFSLRTSLVHTTAPDNCFHQSFKINPSIATKTTCVYILRNFSIMYHGQLPSYLLTHLTLKTEASHISALSSSQPPYPPRCVLFPRMTSSPLNSHPPSLSSWTISSPPTPKTFPHSSITP